MITAEQIMRRVELLPDDVQTQVLSFIEQIDSQRQLKSDTDLNEWIREMSRYCFTRMPANEWDDVYPRSLQNSSHSTQ